MGLVLLEGDSAVGAGTFAGVAADAFALVVNLEGGFAVIVEFPEGFTVGASALASLAADAVFLINNGIFSYNKSDILKIRDEQEGFYKLNMKNKFKHICDS